jgi:hypothetical protein
VGIDVASAAVHWPPRTDQRHTPEQSYSNGDALGDTPCPARRSRQPRERPNLDRRMACRCPIRTTQDGRSSCAPDGAGQPIGLHEFQGDAKFTVAVRRAGLPAGEP